MLQECYKKNTRLLKFKSNLKRPALFAALTFFFIVIIVILAGNDKLDNPLGS
ncbi:hypothetical protein ME789_03030 [Lactobacillus delbrueckii]|nr:hypothetical protein ME789_03030 [Lactobacillus delbrueckii]